MKTVLTRAVALIALFFAGPVVAADNTLLIQLQADGSYRVWHAEGDTQLTDDELTLLSAKASAEGSEPLVTAAGPARAFEIPHAVRVELPEAPADKMLLIERDACGGVRVWHTEGTTTLTDEQLTDLVISALPDGGKRVVIGDRYAKAFTSQLGVVAVIWAPVRRPPPQ